jgi:hypothetical protein
MTKSRHPWVGPASGQFLADLRSAGAAIRTSDPRLKSSGEARPSPALTCSAIFLIAPGITPVAPVKPPSARPVPPPKLMPPPSARADQPAQADQPSTNGSQANRAPRTAGPHCARRPGGRRQPPHAAQEPPHPPLTRASTGSDRAGLPDRLASRPRRQAADPGRSHRSIWDRCVSSRGAIPDARQPPARRCGQPTGPSRHLNPFAPRWTLRRQLPLVEAVVAVDLALSSRIVSSADLCSAAACATGWPGISQARRVIEMAEPAAFHLR